MKKLIACLFGLILSMPAFAITCNLYNVADGWLTGYPTQEGTWSATPQEATIMMHLEEGKKYTIVRVAGSGSTFRVQASSTPTLTHGQSLVIINNQGDENVTTKTITVPNGAPYVLIYIRNNKLNAQTCANGFMIVEGTEAPTEYIPYDASCPCPEGQVLQTYTSATGTVSQSPAPTPDAPVEPKFYTQGNMTLRKVGDYADSYDATTGKITRRVGEKVLNGTESWGVYNDSISGAFTASILTGKANGASAGNICAYFPTHVSWNTFGLDSTHYAILTQSTNGCTIRNTDTPTLSSFKSWLAERYAAGAPVTVYYPLAEPVEEDWAAEQCVAPIKIATNAFNAARFSPVVTALNTAISTIKNVVSNTISQTAAVASLQTNKQQRPNPTATDGTCPDYKQCLLVEDSSGVPHWYVITDPFRDFVTPIVANSVNGWDYIGHAGYTQVEYLQFVTGVQNATNSTYIDTGIYLTNNHTIKVKVNTDNNTGNFYGVMGRYNTSNNTTSFQFFNSSFRFGTDRLSNSINGYLGQTVTLSFGQNGLFVNDTLIATPAQQTFTLPLTCLIGSVGSSDSNFGGKIYEAWIELNGAVIAHYVPARRNGDGVLGMYDVANDQFYTNAGTGTFTAGPDVANPNPALPTTPTWTVAWAPDSDYAGSVNGIAKCNNSSSDATATTSGSNCWCRVTSILVDGTTTNVDGAWAFRTGSGWTDSCVAECATSCAAGVYNNATFRRTVFGM